MAASTPTAEYVKDICKQLREPTAAIPTGAAANLIEALYLAALPTLRQAAIVSQPEVRTSESLEAEIGMLREKLSDALAGGLPHLSDCAVYQAPAYEPGPCTCGVGIATDDNAYDLVRKLREHNGWSRDVTDTDAVSLVRSFVASARGDAAQAPKVTDGYVLVPRKITFAMIAAGWAAFRRDKPPVQLLGPGKGFVEAWEAMLAASPLSSASRGTEA